MLIRGAAMAEDNILFLSGVENKLRVIARWFSIIAAFGLFAMMVITAIDVFGRWLFTKPFYGAYELVGTLLIIAGPFAMAITQTNKRHISIDLVVSLLPVGVRKVLKTMGLLLDLFIYGMITIGLFVLTYLYWERGPAAVSEELGFRLIFPAICFFLASLLYTLVIIVHFIQSLHMLLNRVQ